jgi:hypothetical protein
MPIDVVAGGQDVDARVEQLGRRAPRYAEPARDVLPVRDHQVGVVAIHQRGQRGRDCDPARLADDVSQEHHTLA